MNKISVIILSFLMSYIGLSAQDLVADTIDCGNVQVIMKMPKVMFRSGHVSRYEEGFDKAYAIFSGNEFMVLGFHFGPMSYDVRFEDVEMNLYNCRLGNVARSRAFTRDSLFFRQDSYFIYSIDISYENIPEEKRALMDSILDNVKIVSIPSR